MKETNQRRTNPLKKKWGHPSWPATLGSAHRSLGGGGGAGEVERKAVSEAGRTRGKTDKNGTRGSESYGTVLWIACNAKLGGIEDQVGKRKKNRRQR